MSGHGSLGAAYLTGGDVIKNLSEGVQWLNKAYEHGEGLAARNLSVYYWSGQGEPRNEQKTVEWAVKAAKCIKPNTERCTIAARAYLLGNDSLPQNINKALELYEISAEKGDAQAVEELALIYSDPTYGIAQDEVKALALFEKGALIGRELSTANYKKLCEKLYGEEGKKRFLCTMEKAVENGYCQAYVEIFLCYMYGLGTQKDERKALEYLDIAADANYPEALAKYGIAYHYGMCGLEKNEQKAIAYFQKAADFGNIQACFYAGNTYKEQYAITKNADDKKKCCAYLKKAAEAGYVDAMFTLAEAIMDFAGENPADYEQYCKSEREALIWKEKAANAGHSRAIFDLAFEAFINENEQNAFKWLR